MINLTPYIPYMPLRIDNQLAIVGRTAEGQASIRFCASLEEMEAAKDEFIRMQTALLTHGVIND